MKENNWDIIRDSISSITQDGTLHSYIIVTLSLTKNSYKQSTILPHSLFYSLLKLHGSYTNCAINSEIPQLYHNYTVSLCLITMCFSIPIIYLDYITNFSFQSL